MGNQFNFEEMVIDVDIEKLVNGISALEKVPRAIEIGVNNGIAELGQILKQKMIENLAECGLGESKLASSITITPLPSGIAIGSNSDYAMFVEFGTGLKGAINPHPHPWSYDVNNHGQKGWWYPTTMDDPNPVKRYGAGGNVWAWTSGMPHRPFMYDAWLWGTQSATNIIRKHIRAELLKINGVR